MIFLGVLQLANGSLLGDFARQTATLNGAQTGHVDGVALVAGNGRAFEAKV